MTDWGMKQQETECLRNTVSYKTFCDELNVRCELVAI